MNDCCRGWKELSEKYIDDYNRLVTKNNDIVIRDIRLLEIHDKTKKNYDELVSVVKEDLPTFWSRIKFLLFRY